VLPAAMEIGPTKSGARGFNFANVARAHRQWPLGRPAHKQMFRWQGVASPQDIVILFSTVGPRFSHL